MTGRIEKDAIDKRTVIKEVLKNIPYCTLTIDHWTSIANEGYLGVTVHYIDEDWALNSVALEVCEVNESHTANNIANMLEEIEERWGLENQVVAYVTDNARNIVGAIESMARKRGHIRCNAHTIQLAVNKRLKSDLIAVLLAKCRRVVGHFKHSPLATRALYEAQKKDDLPTSRLTQDVITRWNSTSDMLQSILTNHSAINAVLQSKILTEGMHVTLEERKIMEGLNIILSPFKEATEILGGEKYVTGSMSGTVLRNLIGSLEMKVVDSREIKDVKKLIKDNLVDRAKLKCEELNCAAALDPRYKNLKHLSQLEKDITWDRIKVEALSVVAPLAAIDEGMGDNEEPATKKPKGIAEESDDEDEQEQTPFYRLEQEIKQFAEMKKTDKLPLQWWLENAATYPALSVIARKYLCCIATSVPCERLFSKAGGTVTKNRNRLTGEHVNDLVFLNGLYNNESKQV